MEHDNVTFTDHTNRYEFINLEPDQVMSWGDDETWAMTSKVHMANNMSMHIPMMNFHLEDGVELKHLITAIDKVCGNWKGFILASGRPNCYYYYGNSLLTHDEWVKWMVQFLGPCILVSPRYIGHRISHGYSSLRLGICGDIKPKIPTVVHCLNI